MTDRSLRKACFLALLLTSLVPGNAAAQSPASKVSQRITPPDFSADVTMQGGPDEPGSRAKLQAWEGKIRVDVPPRESYAGFSVWLLDHAIHAGDKVSPWGAGFRSKRPEDINLDDDDVSTYINLLYLVGFRTDGLHDFCPEYLTYMKEMSKAMSAQAPQAMTCRYVGDEQLSGRRTRKWLLKISGRSQWAGSEAGVWIDPELRFMLASNFGGVLVRLEHIRPGPPERSSLQPATQAVPANGQQLSGDIETPGHHDMIDGDETVQAMRLLADGRIVSNNTGGRTDGVLFQLPSTGWKSQPKLLGMVDLDAGLEQIFIGWSTDPPDQAGEVSHHVQVFRGKPRGPVELVSELVLAGGPRIRVRFFRPPDRRDTPKVIIDVAGGATWGTPYLLAPDDKSVQKLSDASDYEFADLDHDGVYELIAWNRRPFDARCNFGIFDGHLYPEIYVRSAETFRKAWPPQDWTDPDFQLIDRVKGLTDGPVPWGAAHQVMALVTDLEGDGTAAIVALSDRFTREPGSQEVGVYRVKGGQVRLVTRAPLGSPRVGFFLSLAPLLDSRSGQRIIMHLADRDRCQSGGNPWAGSGLADAVYSYRAGRLDAVSR
jgi:hypothetical protein